MSNELAVQAPAALQSIAILTGLDKQYLIETIKNQCFKNGTATDAQVDAFISIACEMKVNPLLPGMLYAYPIQGGGIVPIMGPSGVYKKLVEHPEVDSWETTVFPADVTVPPTHAVTKIYRKGRERPLEYTALLSEWKIGTNPNWNSRPRHMLALRSLKHCANQIIHGIPYDEDDRVIMGLTNVTGTGEAPAATGAQPEVVQRPAPPKRAAKGAAAVIEQNNPKEVVGELVTDPVPDTNAAMKAREQKMAEASKVKVAEPIKSEPAKVVEAEIAKVVEQAKVEPTVTPRAFIKDQEELTVLCEVVSLGDIGWAEPVLRDGTKKKMATVVAVVSGGFSGKIYHFGGADDQLKPIPEWTVGNKVRLKLYGKQLKNGSTQARVESVQMALPQLVRTALDLDHKLWDATAEHAYLIADAMLKARETG